MMRSMPQPRQPRDSNKKRLTQESKAAGVLFPKRKQNMKRFFSLFLAVLMAVSMLTACGGGETADEKPASAVTGSDLEIGAERFQIFFERINIFQC